MTHDTIHWETSEDMTFEQALNRLSDLFFKDPEPQVRRMAQAIGLAYGCCGTDVLWMAAADAAIAQHQDQYHDVWLQVYPPYCRGKGANYS